MLSNEAILIRNKIMGVLLRKARLDANKTVQECAQVLSCDPALITRAEEGQESLTLPQLESLAHLLRVPLPALTDPNAMTPTDEEHPVPYENMMIIRRKIIGVILRQARQEGGWSLDQIANQMGYTPEQLARVELGEAQIPLTQLQALAELLNLPFETFVADDVIPLTPEQRRKHELQMLDRLPPQVRDFCLQPVNIPYLELAMNLSQMSSQALRQVASSLLEITY
jgi:transcriptional regulator with XRE-family HTH domain